MVTVRTTAAFAATMAVAALVAPAAAQAPAATGSVRGVVTDKEFGAPIPGAAVTVLGTRARVTTADNGSYIVPNLPEGVYTLVITKDGFVREVRPNVRVGGGALVDADVVMAGEFEDMEEFVVQDMVLGGEPLERQELVVPDTFEPILVIPPIDFQLRLEAPQLLNVLNVEMITRSGASDAAAALLMVPGASLQDGKYAVIRGLPDRYVATLLDGVRLPSADPDVRAVKLDQFPAAIIKSIQVSKNFTPDQQGDASGGAVNVELRDMPDEGYLRISSQVGFNSQVQNGQFLTYKGAGMDFWGDNNVLAQQPDLAGQSWPNNPTGTEFGDAPMIYKWNVAAGDSWEVDDGVKVGAFGNFFYEQDASAYDNGQLNTLMQVGANSPLTPRPVQQAGIDDFKTELFDVTQGTTSIQWGGMGALGLETEEHRLGAKFLYTLVSETQAIRLIDTRGAEYFRPGYDPSDPASPGYFDFFKAPWNRLETLSYSQLSTQAVILNGTHVLGALGPEEEPEAPDLVGFLAPVVDWRFSLSKAEETLPDQTQFGAIWTPTIIPGLLPEGWTGYPPAQNSQSGWANHINYGTSESSTQGALNLKLPFLQWEDREGYVKAGSFVDVVDRSYTQSTYANTLDPNTFYQAPFDDPWSLVFPSQVHPINPVESDINYDGSQDIIAFYGMADIPFAETMNLVTGVRFERTVIDTQVAPDAPTTIWVDPTSGLPRDFSAGTADANAAINSNNFLPMVGWNWNITEELVVRAAFAQTIARPTFFEIVPVLQYDYVGGPIFIGNPALQLSTLDNYDARVDWMPFTDWLVSGSVFYKSMKDPIQYVSRFAQFGGFQYTTAENFPSGSLLGIELESRVTMGPILGDEWEGLKFGANFTYMESQVELPQDQKDQWALYGLPQDTQQMTQTPEFLVNLNATYDHEPTGTQFGLFYNYRGDALVSGGVPNLVELTPAIYQLGYGTLNFTMSQAIIDGLRLSLNAKNLLNPVITTEYQTPNGITGLNSSYTAGIDFSIALTYQIAF